MVPCKTSDCHRYRRLRYGHCGSPDLCCLRARRTRRPEFTSNQLLNVSFSFLLFSLQAWDSPSLSSYEACTMPQARIDALKGTTTVQSTCVMCSHSSRTGRLKSHIFASIIVRFYIDESRGSRSPLYEERNVFQDLGGSQWSCIRG
jgi:hypothetical protein